MIRKICEFSLSLNDVHRPDWASTTMPADLVDVSVLSQDGRLRLGSSSSVSQKSSPPPFFSSFYDRLSRLSLF
jgi:hypothetical protein